MTKQKLVSIADIEKLNAEIEEMNNKVISLSQKLDIIIKEL